MMMLMSINVGHQAVSTKPLQKFEFFFSVISN